MTRWRLRCGCICEGLRVIEQCWDEGGGAWPPCSYPIYKALVQAGADPREVARPA